MSEQPRLSLLLPSLAAGGVGRVMLHLAEAFDLAGYAVDLVLCEKEGPYLEALPSGVSVVTLARQSGFAARWRIAQLDPLGVAAAARPALLARYAAPVQPYVDGLAEYLKRVRPAALLAAKTHTNLLAVWARRASKTSTRVVLAEHTQLSQSIQESRKWRWRHIAPLVGRAYPWADAIAAVSDGVADDLARTAKLPRESITTVYNPVVTPSLRVKARGPAPHPWLAQPDGTPVLVAAGRLVQQKDFPLLLHAFARLRERRRARLLIFGEGRERPALEALAQALGIAADVALPGLVANPYAAFSRASLFVLSSAWEGLPTVLIEALACGCPVVSTDCPSGPSEILAGGRYGALVQPGDAGALAGAMEQALDAPLPRALLQRRGEEFDLTRSAVRYLELMLPEQAGRDALARRPEERVAAYAEP